MLILVTFVKSVPAAESRLIDNTVARLISYFSHNIFRPGSRLATKSNAVIHILSSHMMSEVSTAAAIMPDSLPLPTMILGS